MMTNALLLIRNLLTGIKWSPTYKWHCCKIHDMIPINANICVFGFEAFNMTTSFLAAILTGLHMSAVLL